MSKDSNIDDWEALPASSEVDDWETLPSETLAADDWEAKPSDEDPKNMSASDIRETPAYGGDAWTPTEITKVAKKHGVPEAWVKKEINWAQGETQEQADADLSIETLERDAAGAARVLGGTLDKALGHIPSNIFGESKTKDEQRAIDDIREISSKKLSLVSDLANIRGLFATGGELIKGAQGLANLIKSAKLVKASTSPIGIATLGAAEGAAWGASEARTDEELEGALLGAAFGGAAGGALGMFSKFYKTKDLEGLKPKEIEDWANSIGLNYTDELDAIRKSKGKFIDNVEAFVKDEKWAEALGEQITRAERMAKVLKKTKANQAYDKEKLKELRDIRSLGKYFVSQGKRGQLAVRDEVEGHLVLKALKKKMPDPVSIKKERNWKLSMIDNLQAGKILDGKYGWDLEKVFQNLGEALNHSKNVTKEGYEFISKQLPKGLKSVNVAQAVGKAVRNEEESATREMFDGLKGLVEKKFKVTLPSQKDFIVPRMTKTHQDWLVALDDKLRETFDVKVTKGDKGIWKISDADKLKLRDASRNPDTAKDAQDLLSHVNEVTGAKGGNFEGVEAAFNHVRGTGKADDFNIARLMKRDEDAIHIPEWALETDVETLAYRYIRDLSKGVAIQRDMVKLDTFKKLAEAAQDGGTTNWLGDLVSDIKGVPRSREGLQSFSLANSYSTFMDKMSSNAMIAMARGDDGLKNQSIALAPHAANLMTRLIYPNLLSKPISFMKNLASPYFSTLPYLISNKVGAQEALKITMMSTMDTVKQLNGMRHLGKDGKPTAGFWKGLREGEKEILERGLVHSQFTGEMAEKMANESLKNLKKDKVLGKLFAGAEGAEKVYANTLLYMFQASETMARINSMNMAKRLSQSMAANPKFAKNVIASTDSPSFANKWKNREMPSKNSPDYAEFETDMISLINANTMFNYDRANMSGYGRTMGPLFSQFSKWPLMMLGKAAAPRAIESNRDATMRTVQALFLPMAVAMAADQVAKGLDLYDEPTYKTWVGSLQSYAPGDAFLGAFKDDATSTPAMQFLFGIPQLLANPREAIPEHLKNGWEYFGGGGAEKVGGAIYSTLTNEKANLPSRQAYHSLRETLKEKKEK